ncbi:MAG: hypothetical protein GY783_17685, partial [Gammaproteobacteria bacterium]|nr:hypothetical protein [Gammaproteobacteria bacterium]
AQFGSGLSATGFVNSEGETRFTIIDPWGGIDQAEDIEALYGTEYDDKLVLTGNFAELAPIFDGMIADDGIDTLDISGLSFSEGAVVYLGQSSNGTGTIAEGGSGSSDIITGSWFFTRMRRMAKKSRTLPVHLWLGLAPAANGRFDVPHRSI